MIDIHTHILYCVDDGVKTLNESIDILKNMSEKGVTDVFLTPHYVEYSTYISNVKNNMLIFNNINENLKKNNININIHLGNEIYITENILELLDKNEIRTLGSSSYLLIELPMSGEYDRYMDIFLDLINNGYKVILAHPERYIYFQNHFNELISIHNKGILFQVNLESILGKYGNKAKKTIKKLLKEKIVDFVGSDIHYNKENYLYIDEAKNKFKKYLNDEEINNIFNVNPRNILK